MLGVLEWEFKFEREVTKYDKKNIPIILSHFFKVIKNNLLSPDF